MFRNVFCNVQSLFDVFVEGVKEIKTTLIDDERKAKERGWERAAAKFKPAVEKIKSEIEAVQAEYNAKDVQSDSLISEIEVLRERKKFLESKLQSRAETLSKKSGVSMSILLSSVGTSSCIGGSNNGFSLFDLLFSGKEAKLQKLEEEGFNDAKDFFEKEIAKAKAEFEEKKAALEPEIKKLADLIDAVMNDIAEVRMKIAELEALV